MKNRDRGGPRPQPAPNQPFLIRPGLIGTRIHDLGIRTLAGRIFLLAATYRCHCRAVFQPHCPPESSRPTVNSPTTADWLYLLDVIRLARTCASRNHCTGSGAAATTPTAGASVCFTRSSTRVHRWVSHSLWACPGVMKRSYHDRFWHCTGSFL